MRLIGRRPVFDIGAPDVIGWWVGGRPAMREEIEADADAAVHAIRGQLDGSNGRAWAELDNAYAALIELLDEQPPHEVH